MLMFMVYHLNTGKSRSSQEEVSMYFYIENK